MYGKPRSIFSSGLTRPITGFLLYAGGVASARAGFRPTTVGRLLWHLQLYTVSINLSPCLVIDRWLLRNGLKILYCAGQQFYYFYLAQSIAFLPWQCTLVFPGFCSAFIRKSKGGCLFFIAYGWYMMVQRKCVTLCVHVPSFVAFYNSLFGFLGPREFSNHPSRKEGWQTNLTIPLKHSKVA